MRNNLLSLVMTTAFLVFGTLLTSVQAQELLYVAGTPIYGVGGNGDLFWYKHIGYQTGNFDWSNKGTGIKVGNSWGASLFIFKGNPKGRDGVIYRVATNGDLYWYKHHGSVSGGGNWEQGKKIGNGWNVSQVFSGSDGIIYFLRSDGTLWWQKHEDYAGGSAVWANGGSARKVAEAVKIDSIDPISGRTTYVRWDNAKFVFSGGGGIIYMIDNKGDLYWNRHLGFQDGTDRWEKRRRIGSGWSNLKQVFAGEDGNIYAVKNDGTLLWQKHEGIYTGAAQWANNGAAKVIGSGWFFNFAF